MADFQLGRIKFKWRGDWASSTAYVIDDIVKYGGNSYVVKANHSGQYPTGTDGTTNSTYWDLVIKGFNYKEISIYKFHY